MSRGGKSTQAAGMAARLWKRRAPRQTGLCQVSVLSRQPTLNRKVWCPMAQVTSWSSISHGPARHLPYDYKISFADSIRFNANVHKVFFALEISRIWLSLGNWANVAVTHRCLSSLKCSKCKQDRRPTDLSPNTSCNLCASIHTKLWKMSYKCCGKSWFLCPSSVCH